MMGSPPHARGKGAAALLISFILRITPACAGKRRNGIEYLLSSRDHPRMRGEKNWCDNSVSIKLGSPPHARGKALSKRSGCFLPRITPACAGKRFAPAVIFVSPEDHPRMRGEKYSVEVCQKAEWGSPPHARGKAIIHGMKC